MFGKQKHKPDKLILTRKVISMTILLEIIATYN